MQRLYSQFLEKYNYIQTDLIRDFIDSVDWRNRFIGIRGSRGVGKTTLILQYIKLNYKPNHKVLYISLDDFYFLEHRLYDVATDFYKKGGELLVIDEVHRLSDWAITLKNMYDNMPQLKVIFTGSSLLHIRQSMADLSRRVVFYDMSGLSFREFILFVEGIRFPKLKLNEVLENHIKHSLDITKQLKPLAYFSDYLHHGYYPFFIENIQAYHQKLNAVVMTILEVDIPQSMNIQIAQIALLKKLLAVISRSAPFKPNINSLSERTGISVNTLKNYLKYMNDAQLIQSLFVLEKGINSLGKPEKIYLDNTNLMYNTANEVEIGNARETFFYNQVKQNHLVFASPFTDFMVEEKFHFEIGSKNKKQKQIKQQTNAFIVKDDIEIGYENQIPLWLFGFLY